ncbi:MAG: hypothetical protein Sapg2KO_48680 [Saprospiraceae bacterium]
MEDKDQLKDILGNVTQIDKSIDLESVVLDIIEQQERSKVQIARYKANGFKALIVTAILLIVLVLLFSRSDVLRSMEYTVLTYTSITLALLTLFAQLEMGERNIFNHPEKNLT